MSGCKDSELSSTEKRLCGAWKARHRNLELKLTFDSDKEYELQENDVTEVYSGHWYVDSNTLVLREYTWTDAEKYHLTFTDGKMTLDPLNSYKLATTWREFKPPWYRSSGFGWFVGITVGVIFLLWLLASNFSSPARQPQEDIVGKAASWVSKQATDWSKARDEKKEIERLRRSETLDSLKKKRKK